ncbi:hypothetical protein SUGI_0243550 [Cryptomeria japonica]|nr:hypothetical protein SUGI_0243550 [Cryptomeria japonica]
MLRLLRTGRSNMGITTKGFRDGLLGRGIYKGVLPSNGIELAMKRVSRESKQGLREFISEISSIGRLQRQNLVQLELLLVYDDMPNGSLDSLLFGDKKNIISWE